MTAYSTDISVSARYADLPELLAKLAQRANELGITDDNLLRLQLVAEELFVNTISHGHQGDSSHPVTIALRCSDGILTLRYADDAPPFDMSKIGQNPQSTVEVGGQGLNLIHGMSKAIHYRRQESKNITEIMF